MHDSLSLRKATDDDREFLYRVYAGTRAEELAVVDWTNEQKEEFLRMQFHAQDTHYKEHFSDAQFDIIQQHDQPIGRLYMHRRDDELRIVDIALLPECRGQGLGESIMRDILDEGAAAGLPVRIHVEVNNPAMHLYQRLGFQPLGEPGVYQLMEWTPG